MEKFRNNLVAGNAADSGDRIRDAVGGLDTAPSLDALGAALRSAVASYASLTACPKNRQQARSR